MTSLSEHPPGRTNRTTVIATSFAVALAFLTLTPPARAANPLFTVDLATSTGAPTYSATGFLHGLAYDNSPTAEKISALKAQVSGQKAPDGLQHAEGDPLQIGPYYFRNGGKQVMIYMQDIYAEWPYPKNLTDYRNKVTTMVNKVKAAPDKAKYVYVPFNEPDWIWYASSGAKLTEFQNDWKTIYQLIRSLDPSALIAGPGFFAYNAAAYRSFYTFAKNNNVLPNYTSWHELETAFFTDWYTHYNDYRKIETDLGIAALPININEYGRSSGDMGIPGQMIKYIARFEASKVAGCLASWVKVGDMGQLLTSNFAKNSAWYLYRQYGEMTGQMVKTTPPTVTGNVQGIASIDSDKNSAIVILGGATGAVDVVVKGFASTSFGSAVRVVVSTLSNTGGNPSTGPTTTSQTNYTVSNGQLTVTLSGLVAANTYSVTLAAGAGNGFDPNRTYRIVNRNSNKALDVTSASTLDAAAVVQWNYTGVDSQRWYIVDMGGGYSRIVNANSGRALDVNAKSTADGATIIQWTWGAGTNQQWSFTGLAGNYFRVDARHSGKSLEVLNSGTTDGAAVDQRTYSGANNQQWMISPS